MGRLLLFLVMIPLLMAMSFQEGRTMGADALKLKSGAFEHEGMIPVRYTCDGENISPSLSWSRGPARTASYALIADDPDAPVGTWVHWVLFNIPPPVTNLPEAVPPIEKLANAERHGVNDFRKLGYGGPCPPSGTHRYFFKIYALDTMLGIPAGVTKKELEEAMRGHILAQGELVGKYKRK